MKLEFVLPLITAFGLGSIITTAIQSWLQNRSQIRKRNFEERKQAYIGLLEAYHKAAVEGTDKAAKEFAYWQMRCELVSPPSVRNSIAKIVETNDDKTARYLAHEELKNALRQDLDVSSK